MRLSALDGLAFRAYATEDIIHKTISKTIPIMNKEFSRTRSAQDIAISVILIIAGLACVICKTPVGVNILGCCAIILGIVLFCMLKSCRKDKDSGICYKLKIKYYPAKRQEEILNALKTDPSSIDWTESGSEEGLRVDIFYSKAGNKAFVQCYKYVPYEYQVLSDWFELPLDKTGNLIG